MVNKSSIKGRNIFIVSAFAIWCVLWSLSWLAGIDLFDSLMRPIHGIHDIGHDLGAGGLIFLAILLMAGKGMDMVYSLWKKRKDAQLAVERQEYVMNTVRTIEDSVLNTFNGCQLLMLEAEEKGYSKETLKLIDEHMHESVTRIRKLLGKAGPDCNGGAYPYNTLTGDN